MPEIVQTFLILQKNKSLHKFPDGSDDCPSEKKRRQAWVSSKLCPTENSRLCSKHFRPENFENPFTAIPGTSFANHAVSKKDLVPSTHKQRSQPDLSATSTSTAATATRTSREQRRVSIAGCLTYIASTFNQILKSFLLCIV